MSSEPIKPASAATFADVVWSAILTQPQIGVKRFHAWWCAFPFSELAVVLQGSRFQNRYVILLCRSRTILTSCATLPLFICRRAGRPECQPVPSGSFLCHCGLAVPHQGVIRHTAPGIPQRPMRDSSPHSLILIKPSGVYSGGDHHRWVLCRAHSCTRQNLVGLISSTRGAGFTMAPVSADGLTPQFSNLS